MRHNNSLRKLGRDSGHRKAMLRNLSISLLDKERIETTLPRAKELRKVVERLITLGKKNSLHHRRLAFATLRNETLVNKLFDEIAPKYTNRPGGYTRSMRTSLRRGDGAQKAIIELVEGVETKVDVKGNEAKKND